MASPTSSIVQLLNRTSSTVPPRPRRRLLRTPLGGSLGGGFSRRRFRGAAAPAPVLDAHADGGFLAGDVVRHHVADAARNFTAQRDRAMRVMHGAIEDRSEEHTSELQSL